MVASELLSDKEMEAQGNRHFVEIISENDIPNAVEMVTSGRWGLGKPDLVISFVTGRESSYLWRQADRRAGFQTAITKLISTSKTMIIDNGLDFGTSALIGSAVRDEENFSNDYSSGAAGPRVSLLGIVPAALAESAKYSSPSSAERALQLDENHQHIVLLRQSVRDAYRLKVAFERELCYRYDSAGFRGDAQGTRTEGSSTVVHVVVFLQGGINELDQVADYVGSGVPVIILQGCGGLADVLASGLANWKGQVNTDFLDQINDTIRHAARGKHGLSETEARRATSKVIEILERSEGNQLSVVDIRDGSGISALDQAVLRTSLDGTSQEADVAEKNWLLAIRSGEVGLANDLLLAKSSGADGRIPNEALMEALVLRDREPFVDLLIQRMPVRNFLTHMDYLMLYQNTQQDSFFVERVWDQILQHYANDPITETFLYNELNPLIYKLSGIRDYLNMGVLSANALGVHDHGKAPDATAQDQTALRAMIVYAVLFNRVELVKILLKYTIDPIPQALFIARLFRSMAFHNTQTDIHAELLQNHTTFDNLATELFEMGYQEFPQRCQGVMVRKVPELNGMTALELAYKGFCLKFLSHTAIQQFIEDYAFGFVRYRGDYGYAKMLASAFLVFPMNKWLSFPQLSRQMAITSAAKAPQAALKDSEKRPSIVQDGARAAATKDQKVAEANPSLIKKLGAIWASPVVKYWIWLITYHLFLILIGVDIMLPPCMYVEVDYAVFACTALIWLDLVLSFVSSLLDSFQFCDKNFERLVDVARRNRAVGLLSVSYNKTIKDRVYGSQYNMKRRTADILIQTAFNIFFFLYRIIPYRETEPFTGRVVLAFGIYYYFYSVWELFLYFPFLTAGVVRLLKKNMLVDMFRWIVLMLPLVIASGVVWQATSTPDWPSTGDDWRHGFYRGIFTIFGGFSYELDYDPTCEATNKITNWSNFTQPTDAYPQDRCWLGHYDNYGCPTVTVWSYIFVIHYYFLLKLAMLTVLNAYYLHTNMRLTPMADVLCRYKRFQSIMLYAGKSAVPWPFSIFGYILDIVTFKKANRDRLIRALDATDEKIDSDAFTYWRAKAMQYFARKNQESSMESSGGTNLDTLRSVQQLVQRLQSNIGYLDSRLRG